MPSEASRGGFLVSDDPGRIDAAAVHAYISRSYWAEGIPLKTVKRSIENSISFGVYDESRGHAQVGFARVITDRATFAYIGDVYVLEEYRGRGLAKFLMERIRAHPDLQGLRRWMLVTRDAHGLYRQFGFGPLDNPSSVMLIRDRDVYKRQNSTPAERQNSR
jgi:GNAT superfamily N-acetyltransferase